MVHDEKAAVAIILGKIKPKGGAPAPEKHEGSDADEALLACADDLIDAVKAGDSRGVAHALKAAFQIADAMPHHEGSHLEDDEHEAAEEPAFEQYEHKRGLEPYGK